MGSCVDIAENDTPLDRVDDALLVLEVLIDRVLDEVPVGVCVALIDTLVVEECVGVFDTLDDSDCVGDEDPVFDGAKLDDTLRLFTTVAELDVDGVSVFVPFGVAVCVGLCVVVEDLLEVELAKVDAVDVFDTRPVNVGELVDRNVFVSGGEYEADDEPEEVFEAGALLLCVGVDEGDLDILDDKL